MEKKEVMDGINTASTVFYDRDGVAVQHSTIQVPDGWTLKLLLGVLLLEWSQSNTVSILKAEGKLDEITQIRHAYFDTTVRLFS
jgi:hypothetical protein